MAAYAGPHFVACPVVAGLLCSSGNRFDVWPGRTLAGENDAAAAWLLARHADRDPVRRRAFLDALRGAVGQGGLSGASGLSGGRVAGQPAPSVMFSSRR